MKSLLFSAILLVAALSAHAQQIINNSTCSLKLRSACYDPSTCGFQLCNNGVMVAPNTSANLPTCPPMCISSGRKVGYVVCIANTPCYCTNVGDPAAPCSDFPASATLNPCDICSPQPISLSYNMNGDLEAN
jgi:hypothetical protein